MEEFKKYYKFPLQHDSEYRIMIMTEDYGMALDWLVDVSDEAKDGLLQALNGYNPLWHPMGKFVLNGGYIEYERGITKPKRILCVRGWGRLTGTGGYHLPEDKAAEIQDAFAEYCVNMLNKKNNV